MSHTETAQIVVESFYQKDNETLKKYTTTKNYQSLMTVQDMISKKDLNASNFTVINEVETENLAWVKFKTDYETIPETFKLVKTDNQWKVTIRGLREPSPFESNK